MARVVLVSLFDEWALALRYVAAALKEAGHAVLLVFLEVCASLDIQPVRNRRDDLVFPAPCAVPRRDMELLIDEIAGFRPDFIGMTVVSNLFDLAALTTRWIRRELGVPVVWGGPDPTANPQGAEEYADVVCVGEGEQAVVHLASMFDDHVAVGGSGMARLESVAKPIPNLRIRQQSGWLRGEEGLVAGDLDSIHFPLFEAAREVYAIDGGLFRGEHPPTSRVPFSIPVVASRGCPFRCSYCCHAVQRRLSRSGKYYRRRSPENVIAELAARTAHFPRLSMIEIYDSVFTLDDGWLERFADLYGRTIRIPFWCYTYPGLTSERVLRRLKEIGLSSVTFGVQSGSERTCREVFDRPTTRERIFETARILHGLGIPYAVDVIGSNPFESEEDRFETVRLLAELPKPYFLHRVNPLLFFPGYLITEKARREGIPLQKSHGSSMTGPRSPRLASWDALMTLAQFPHVNERTLRVVSENEEMMKRPEALWDLALAFTEASYCTGNVYDIRVGQFEQMMRTTKDQRLRELETELGSLYGSRLIRATLRLRRWLHSHRHVRFVEPRGSAVLC